MSTQKNLYETIVVLHPELTEEEVETSIQSIVKLLEGRGSDVIRMERGGKRRLAYPVRKQRYGYYNLLHFRAAPELPVELERTFRLNERVIRYLTVRFDKEEQLSGFTRLTDDEGHDEEREDRRRGGRRGDGYRPRPYTRGFRAGAERETPDDEDEEFGAASEHVAEESE
jgi:small subunit ribosomal protein S6